METDEYSESGRGVYPDGLYRMLLHFNERYKHLNLPFIITENGVSDETDLIRQPYLLEHLLATYAAMISVLTILTFLASIQLHMHFGDSTFLFFSPFTGCARARLPVLDYF